MSCEPAQASPSDQLLAHAFAGCLATTIRQADRLVALVFDEKLRVIGLRGTQLTLLAGVAQLGNPSQSDLAHATHTDATTLSRNLDRLLERGLVDRVDCERDRRVRRYLLTEAGRRTLAQAVPHWQAAQREIADRLGADLCEVLGRVSIALTHT